MGLRQGKHGRFSLTRIYKILSRSDWEAARASGRYGGSAVDRADGFIHFSTAGQAAETARRHFQGQDDLVVLTVNGAALGEALKWEPSRGGALFPHLYGDLPVDLVLAARPAPLDEGGVPDLGVLEPDTDPAVAP
jgi:uncharacterized protein (DUF952 family)